MAIRKSMSKKTDPPAKKSAAGPYKTGMKTDRSTGVRKMTDAQKKAAANKPKGGDRFLPKGVPAGNKKKVPASKTKPRTKNTYPGSMEQAIDIAKGNARKTGSEIRKSMERGVKWVENDMKFLTDKRR